MEKLRRNNNFVFCPVRKGLLVFMILEPNMGVVKLFVKRKTSIVLLYCYKYDCHRRPRRRVMVRCGSSYFFHHKLPTCRCRLAQMQTCYHWKYNAYSLNRISYLVAILPSTNTRTHTRASWPRMESCYSTPPGTWWLLQAERRLNPKDPTTIHNDLSTCGCHCLDLFREPITRRWRGIPRPGILVVSLGTILPEPNAPPSPPPQQAHVAAFPRGQVDELIRTSTQGRSTFPAHTFPLYQFVFYFRASFLSFFFILLALFSKNKGV